MHVGRGEGDRRVGLAGLRVGRVVDASDAHAERDREGVALGGDGHLVQHDRLEVALGLAGALQVGKLALLEDGARGLGRGRGPGGARLLEAEVVERGADVDDDGALERVRGVGRVEVVGRGVLLVGERAGVGAGEGELLPGGGADGRVGRRGGGGAHDLGRDHEGVVHAGGHGLGLGADGHFLSRACVRSAVGGRASRRALSLIHI